LRVRREEGPDQLRGGDLVRRWAGAAAVIRGAGPGVAAAVDCVELHVRPAAPVFVEADVLADLRLRWFGVAAVVRGPVFDRRRGRLEGHVEVLGAVAGEYRPQRRRAVR